MNQTKNTTDVQNYEQMYVIEMEDGSHYVVTQEVCQRIRSIRSHVPFFSIGEEEVRTRDIRKIRKATPQDVWLRSVLPPVRELVNTRIQQYRMNTNRLPTQEIVARWIDTATREGAASLFA